MVKPQFAASRCLCSADNLHSETTGILWDVGSARIADRLPVGDAASCPKAGEGIVEIVGGPDPRLRAEAQGSPIDGIRPCGVDQGSSIRTTGRALLPGLKWGWPFKILRLKSPVRE